MRVLFHQGSARGTRTGVGQYTHHLLGALTTLPDLQVDAYPPTWVMRAEAGLVQMAVAFRSWLPAWRVRKRQRSWGWMRNLRFLLSGLTPTLHLRDAVRRHYFQHSRYQVYHEPNFIPIPSILPTVTTLHDLSVLLHPEWHPTSRVLWYERHFERALRQTTHFIAVSEATRRGVLNVLGIRPERVTCIPNGVRSELTPLPQPAVAAALERLGLPPTYLLHVGTIEPRKNLDFLLRVYCSLPDSIRARYPLVLAGPWGWRCEREREFFDREARHRGVLHVGYVSDADLGAVYNGARALVYPTLYEGFGLPPVEMLACGGAVMASTAEAVAETVGGQAHLIDPCDVDGWRDALLRVLTDDDWWGTLRAGAVESVSGLTWEKCAAGTRDVYRIAAGVTGNRGTGCEDASRSAA